ncbi:unnamed protein product [Mytilus edulis]|uniref:RNase H type-1 domain-containing protein n=1 Tax=Mytilus edulis TaxID=6550 RepID=A0A8S3U2Z0_MYTED|nr:unnamed protein product [Mytilus edulis]
MGSIANCTLSKRAEFLENISIAEPLKDSLLKSPLSDKMFGLPLQRVQEELSKNPPPVKVSVQVTNGKRSVNATSSSNSTSASGGPPSSAKKRKNNYGKPQNKPNNSGKSSEDGRNETGHRPIYSEQISYCSPLQNGNKQIHQGFNPSRNVDYFSGSFRRVFPHSYFPNLQEIPSLRLEQQSFPVQGSPFWPVYSPFGFYQNHAGSYSSPTFPVYSDSFLSGRFPSQGILPNQIEGSDRLGHQLFSVPRLPYLLEKVRDNSVSRLCFPGRTFPNQCRPSPPTRGEIYKTMSENTFIPDGSISHSTSILATSGSIELSGRCNSIGTTSHSSASVLSAQVMDCSFTRMGSIDSNHSAFISHLQWWLVRENVMRGLCLSPQVPSLTLFTDASTLGWGAYLEGLTISGVWSPDLLEEHINVLEMKAVLFALNHFQMSLKNQSVILATDNTTVVAYLKNQGGTHSPSLYQIARDILLLCFQLQVHLVVRHIAGHLNILADTLSRSLAPVNTEWELLQVVFKAVTFHWRSPQIDLFATSLNHKLLTFVSPVPDPKSFAVDAMSLSWKGMFGYAFPPFRFLSPVLQKIAGENCKIIVIAPAWPKQSWFPDLLRLSCACPLVLPLRPDLLSQIKGKVLYQNPEKLHLHAWLLSGLASERGFLKEQQASHKVYWCSEREIDPFQVTVQQLADFLVFLFESKGLCPSTIKGYRSAISRTIHISGGPDFGINEHISLLVRSFSLERPRQKTLVPKWDLGLVLSFLKLPPFEPAETIDLRFLSYKCCFLLALASGRRRSEIHAFSISDACLRFNRDKSSVTLLTDPAFLAKNQIPDKGAEPVVIPALPSDSISVLLCPAELLNSFNVKAHDVRGISTSWALFNSASLEEVLSAGFWRNENSFISHYLQSMATFAESLYSLGPIVSAQRLNFPPVSSVTGDSALR